MTDLTCDFCNVQIKNDGEGSAFCDGSAYSNVGYDDRTACENCCGQIHFEEGGGSHEPE